MRNERSQPGIFVLVVGLGLTLVAVFGLPVQRTALNLGNSIYFGDIRHYSSPAPVARLAMGQFAATWWNNLAFALVALLVVFAAAAAAMPDTRPQTAWATAAVAVLFGGLHTLALAQTSELSQLAVAFRKVGSSFSSPGIGIWITYAGLVLVAAGAIVIGAASGTPAAVPDEHGPAAQAPGEPATEEPAVAGEPADEEPVDEEPAADGEPADGEPADEEPAAAGEPATGAS